MAEHRPDMKLAPAGIAVTELEGEEGPLTGTALLKARAVRTLTQSSLWSRVAAVALALALAGPIFLAIGADPGVAYRALFEGSFGSLRALGDMLNRADTFILLGLGIAIGVRAGFFNVGAEGQLWLGALGSALVAVYWNGPPVLVIAVALAAGFLFGAFWSLLVAFLKLVFGVDELIGSLMLNYVGILLIGYLTFGPIKAYRAGQTERIAEGNDLPTLIPGTRLHIGFVLSLVAIGAIWLLLSKTTLGYEIKTLGGNPDAALFAGISPRRVITRVAVIGGGLCGLAGANIVLGVQHILLSNFSPGFGYTAIAVALLGGLAPAGILVAALLFATLEIGSSTMQYVAQVPSALGGLLEGLILVLFLLSLALSGAFHRVRRAGAGTWRRMGPKDVPPRAEEVG
jgi:ABC-type uncharacterized transport system permease subunit